MGAKQARDLATSKKMIAEFEHLSELLKHVVLGRLDCFCDAKLLPLPNGKVVPGAKSPDRRVGAL
jgi:hypothetical protein